MTCPEAPSHDPVPLPSGSNLVDSIAVPCTNWRCSSAPQSTWTCSGSLGWMLVLFGLCFLCKSMKMQRPQVLSTKGSKWRVVSQSSDSVSSQGSGPLHLRMGRRSKHVLLGGTLLPTKFGGWERFLQLPLPLTFSPVYPLSPSGSQSRLCVEGF